MPANVPRAAHAPVTVEVMRAIASGQHTYGLAIIEAIGSKSGAVYPILTRLLRANLVTRRWETHTDPEHPGKPRRYYALTLRGERWLAHHDDVSRETGVRICTAPVAG